MTLYRLLPESNPLHHLLTLTNEDFHRLTCRRREAALLLKEHAAREIFGARHLTRGYLVDVSLNKADLPLYYLPEN